MVLVVRGGCATVAVYGTAANAVENLIFNADCNAVYNAVPQRFQFYFNLVFNAVSMLFHADLNAVPKAFSDFTCLT